MRCGIQKVSIALLTASSLVHSTTLFYFYSTVLRPIAVAPSLGSEKHHTRTDRSDYGYPDSLDVEALWTGDIPHEEKEGPLRVGDLSIVMSHCNHDLSWFSNFAQGFEFKSIDVVSKCLRRRCFQSRNKTNVRSYVSPVHAKRYV